MELGRIPRFMERDGPARRNGVRDAGMMPEAGMAGQGELFTGRSPRRGKCRDAHFVGVPSDR